MQESISTGDKNFYHSASESFIKGQKQILTKNKILQYHTTYWTFKSRASTPQLESLRPGIAEALQLLQKWNLLELQSIFRDHDITIRSLIYLTEDEICELIPKIGVRTIFRALLKEWRQAYSGISEHREAGSSSFDENEDNESFLDQIELKTECNSGDFEMSNYMKDKSSLVYSRCLEFTHHHQQQSSKNDENNNVAASVPLNDPCDLIHLRIPKTYRGERFIVLDILQGTTEGQTILDFYKSNQFLDIKNRKRIVNILIKNVVGRKVDKYTAIFHDMTRQLLELFPTEKYETYFVPHCGSHSARGALYYRYSNYTRQLRKEGLLAYKKHKPKNENK